MMFYSIMESDSIE